MFAHSFQYKTAKPKTSDFVAAVIAGAESLAAEGRLVIDVEIAKSIITEEATRRGLLDPVQQEQEPEDIFATITAVEERFGGGGLVRFVVDDENVEQRLYQEQYRTREYGYVEVVGAGAVEQVGPDGSAVSAKDVRAINAGEIDETVNINISAAINTAQSSAALTLIEAERRRGALESLSSKRSFMNDDDYRARLAAAQMDHRVAESAVAELGHPGKRTIAPPQSRLVILPDSNELFYEIKAGLGMYYVNAKTGDLSFERHVFVN